MYCNVFPILQHYIQRNNQGASNGWGNKDCSIIFLSAHPTLGEIQLFLTNYFPPLALIYHNSRQRENVEITLKPTLIKTILCCKRCCHTEEKQYIVLLSIATQLSFNLWFESDLENNRWFSAVLLCIYGDNHTRVAPYFESCMAPIGGIHDE